MTQVSAVYSLIAPISVAFRAESPDAGVFNNSYGAGFNGTIEVSFEHAGSVDVSNMDRGFLEFIKSIDHRHLGFDAPELKITTPESLLEYCEQFFLKSQIGLRSLKLQRGFDIVYQLNCRN